jgi:hypothetical protein
MSRCNPNSRSTAAYKAPFLKFAQLSSSHILYMTLTYRNMHAERASTSASIGNTAPIARNRPQDGGRPSPLVGLRAVLFRARADSDLSQQSLFEFCIPLVSFSYLLVVGVVALRWPRAQVSLRNMMGDMENHKLDLTMSFACLIFGLLGAITVLRGIIWVIGCGVEMFIEQDAVGPLGQAKSEDRSDSFELSKTSLLFGGIFM